MQNLSRLRLEFAAVCFLAEMRRRFALSFPDQPNPIKNFDQYSTRDRSALIAAIEKSITSTTTDENLSFAMWLEQRNTNNDTNVH